MIHTLRNDKNQLQEQIETLKKETSFSKYKILVEEIISKNIEIEKLKKQNK